MRFICMSSKNGNHYNDNYPAIDCMHSIHTSFESDDETIHACRQHKGNIVPVLVLQEFIAFVIHAPDLELYTWAIS